MLPELQTYSVEHLPLIADGTCVLVDYVDSKYPWDFGTLVSIVYQGVLFTPIEVNSSNYKVKSITIRKQMKQ